MHVTNTKEVGLENLIVEHLVSVNHFEQGENSDYSREYAIDETRLIRFLQETQPEKVEILGIGCAQHGQQLGGESPLRAW